MGLIAVKIMKMMFVFGLYELLAMRAFPVLLFRYLADIVTHRLHLNQLFSILEIAVPLSIKWIGVTQNLDVSKSMNVIVEPDEGFARHFILESP